MKKIISESANTRRAYWVEEIRKLSGDFGADSSRLEKELSEEKTEKQAAIESIAAAKEEALTFLSSERTKIMQMSHEEALEELVRVHKIESRIEVIKSVSDNGILGVR